MSKNKIIDLFFQYKICEINYENPFTLASGKKSPLYVDHRKIWSIPSLRKLVISEWKSCLEQHLSNFKTVTFAGIATAGITPAYALAVEFDSEFIYIRSSAKDHGTKKMTEGILNPNHSIILVDDMITTGGSLLKSSTYLPKENKIIFATSFTRSTDKSVDNLFSEYGFPLHSYMTTEDILNFTYTFEKK